MQTLTLTRATNFFSQHQDDRYLGLSNHCLCFLSAHPASPPPLLASKRHRLKLAFVAKAADSTQPSSATTSADKTLVPDDEFTLAKVRFKQRPLDDRYLGLSNHCLCFLSVHPASPPPLLASKRHRLKLAFVAKAADSTQPSSATTSADKTLVPDDEFTLAKVSFGVIGLGLGISLLSYGFGAYFSIFPGSEWSALMLTYGFPLAVIGMALKYAELKPVPCLTYSDAQSLRETCATPILKQVRNDVIRFRYGDEQHLDEALKRIFQYGLGGGIPRRSAPVLQMIREEVTEDGKYCLVLVFEAKALKLSDFEKRQAKFTSFFGPGITAEVGKGESENLYEVRLISNTSPNVSSS